MKSSFSLCVGSLQYCLCKSTCQRANKCPCKGKSRFCTARCRCKAKSGPCKNRLAGEDAGPSRVQEALLANQEAVKVSYVLNNIVAMFSLAQVLVQSLDDGQKNTLLIELLKDRGGVQLAKSMLQRGNDDHNQNYQPPQGAPGWCRCGRCREMANAVERVCCKSRPCISTTDAFHDTCLNRNVLTVAILDSNDFYNDDAEMSPNNYRKAAYRQCILYRHGYLGRGNRKVVPSCALWKIRDTYPSPDDHYLGFKPT